MNQWMRANRFLYFAMTVFVSVLWLHSSVAGATINPQIAFQGKLTNPDGTNVTNSSYTFVFSVYTVASGGSNIWTESKSLTVTDGIFTTYLGDTAALPGSVDFNNSSLFLGVKVGADAEMTPRVRLAAAPYSFNSSALGGLASTGFVQLGQSVSAQTDASGNSSIFINKTAIGNLIQIQNSAVDVFNVSNNGDILFGQNTGHNIGVATNFANAAGISLSLSGGQGGAGASANAGGNLVLTGGVGGGTNGSGGNLTLSGGTPNGTGSMGSVTVKSPTNTAAVFQIQNAASTQLFVADSTNSRIYIGNQTADAVGALLVLDTKNTAGDPTGVNGGMYYNSSTNKLRCFQNAVWEDCIADAKVKVAADVPNSTTTMADVTGLTFPVVSGARYAYSCKIMFSAALASTGSRWSVNGPAAPTDLGYTSHWPSSVTAETIRQGSAYDDAATASTNSAGVTGNITFIDGFITPSANGTFAVRFASEVAASAITAKAGSYCEYNSL